MKNINNKGIITDLSSDELILSRFNDELPRCYRWAQKLIPKGLIQEATFQSKFTNDIKYDKYTNSFYKKTEENIGTLNWTSPVNGDTWIGIVSKTDNGMYGVRYNYYWNTIGSSGIMYKSRILINGKIKELVECINSHAMLRYRDRMNLDINPYEEITYIGSTLNRAVVQTEELQNEFKVEIVTPIGVFCGKLNKESLEECKIIRMKTFIPFCMMSKTKIKKYEQSLNTIDTWHENYQQY